MPRPRSKLEQTQYTDANTNNHLDTCRLSSHPNADGADMHVGHARMLCRTHTCYAQLHPLHRLQPIMQ